MNSNSISAWLFRLGAFFALSFCAPYAIGSPTQVAHIDQPTCDPLAIPFDVDELGSVTVPFPQDELIDHREEMPGSAVCLATDDPAALDPIVEIINLTNRTFTEVWYVADPETNISNVDGFAEDALIASSGVPFDNEAFRIDNVFSDPNGTHLPLVFESNPNGLFEPGETWQFVLQDYFNAAGSPPDAFTSFGVGSASMDIAGIFPSSGSIIAIPEPPALPAIAALFAGALVRRRIRSN